MSSRNPIGAKHQINVACPALAAFPQLSDPDNSANGRVAHYTLSGHGGPRTISFENQINTPGPGTTVPAGRLSTPATVSVEQSADGTTYVATTSAINNTAVTQVVIQPSTRRAFDVLLRPDYPYIRITAIGGTQIEMTIDNASGLTKSGPVGVPGSNV